MLLVLLAALASATPVTMSWQGRVLDAAGQPLESSAAALELSLYATPSGGDPLFSEVFTTSIDQGYASVVLGSSEPLDHTVLAGPALYLAVSVDGRLSGERTPLHTTPRAARAEMVPTPYAVPIGGVMPWWRPNAATPLPTGYAVADGSTLPAGAHGFTDASGTPLDTPITLPDLRNRFILGASLDQGDGAAGTPVASPAGAPGIAGTGGSNAPRDLAHTHAVSGTFGSNSAGAHGHSVSGSTNTAGSHGHQLPIGDAGDGMGWQRNWPYLGSTTRDLRLNGYVNDSRPGTTGTYMSQPNGNHSHSVTSTAATAGDHSHTVTVDTATAAAGSAVDTRPAYLGLLYLIRVQ